MKVVVGFSGGVSSAWCAGWALRHFPKEDVVFLFHDTKEEDPDTYRFIHEMAQALDHELVERSDGRSVTEVFRDEDAIANNRMAFCSRILKAKPRDRYFTELRATGETEIINVLGFTAIEWKRVQRASVRATDSGYTIRFPLIEESVSKQQCADWCIAMGVKPSSMYRWSEHANCVGCVRGGKAYWLAVHQNAPDVFEQRAALETEFGHTVLKDTTLHRLVQVGLKRKVKQRESIDIGPCECGD
jgi:hypothetical protein